MLDQDHSAPIKLTSLISVLVSDKHTFCFPHILTLCLNRKTMCHRYSLDMEILLRKTSRSRMACNFPCQQMTIQRTIQALFSLSQINNRVWTSCFIFVQKQVSHLSSFSPWRRSTGLCVLLYAITSYFIKRDFLKTGALSAGSMCAVPPEPSTEYHLCLGGRPKHGFVIS